MFTSTTFCIAITLDRPIHSCVLTVYSLYKIISHDGIIARERKHSLDNNCFKTFSKFIGPQRASLMSKVTRLHNPALLQSGFAVYVWLIMMGVIAKNIHNDQIVSISPRMLMISFCLQKFKIRSIKTLNGLRAHHQKRTTKVSIISSNYLRLSSDSEMFSRTE